MATLVFRVSSDWQEVVKLRQECEKLEAQLKKMDSRTAPAATKVLETQLASTKQQMMGLVTEAAKAGAAMENGFKKKIYDASQTVNGLSEKIIAQRAVIKDIEFDVKRLGEAYRTALKNNPISASGKLAEYNAARKVLDEEKATLFGLTQQQAEARLSVKRLRDEYSLYKQEAGETIEANNGLSVSWQKMLGVIGGATALKALASQIIRVRGEFQSMQTAIETIVGKDVASGLMSNLKEMAKISPLTLTDMVDAEKMMLGFNIQAEDTIKYLQALSDISMGDSVKFKSLTLAFSQMSAAGKLMGQDLNQMINAGFNPLQIIAEKTGKSIATLKDEMSKGAVSAEMVQQAFIDATSAGGKFYQMSENASKTINGQLSMMQDALDNAFNEMGQASEGVIMEGIQLTTTLIQNYETVGKVLVGLVATYGAYRTAVMLATIATNKHTIAEIALTNARVIARKAQMLLNAAMLTNPYVAVATVVTALVATMWAFRDSSTEAEKAQARFNQRQQEAQRIEEEHKQRIEALVNSSRDIALADVQRGRSLAELRREYPKIFEQYDIESIKLADILKLKQQIAEEDARRAEAQKSQEVGNLDSQIAYYEKLLKSMSGQQGVDGYVKKLKELRADRDVLLRERGKSISEQFVANLKDIDISEFDRYIGELEKRIKGKGENGTIKLRLPIDVKGSLSDEALYLVKDIKTLIDTAKSTKQARIDSGKTTYKDDYEQARKDWEEAKKELQKIESDKDKFTSKQYEDAKKRVESTEKAYKELGGLTGTALSKQQKEADKEKKNCQKLSDQLLALQEKNQQAEVNLMKEGTEKKLAQIDADYSAQKAAIDRQQRELAEANKEAGITSTNASGLTSEQQVEIDRANELAFESRKKQIEEVYRAETDAMRAYISEYGTFQQQKLAIAEDYAERIRKAQTEGERLTLGRERDAALQQVDINALQQNIDWGSVFGEFGTMFREQLQPTIDRLKAIAGSDTFRQSSLEDQQLLYDLIARLEESNTVWDSDIFRRVSDDMNAYQSTMQGYIDAQERERIATDALAKAKANLVEAERRGGDVESAQQKVDLAASYLASVSDEVQAFGAQVKQTTADLQSSAQQAVGMFQSLESGLQGLTSGSLKGIGQGIMQLDSLFEGDLTKQAGNVLAEGFQSLLGKDSKAAQVLTKALGDTGMAGEIISAVLGMLDLIAKEGLSGIVTSLQDTVFGAVNSLLDDVLNFRIVRDSAKNLMGHMGNILDTVTFGGFSKLTSIGSNAKETAEKIADLTASNDALRTAIDGLKDEIEGTNGTKSINAYNEAIAAQKKYEENLRQILDAQMRYTGSHHSNAYYWNLDASSLRQVNALLGTSLGNTWDDFSRLTADQMNQIRTHLPEVWSEMINEGKYGDRFKEDWENYADQAGEVVEMTDQLRESLAQISFDNMRDSFVDSLMDMDAEAADFANDFSQYMMRSLLNFSIGDQLDEQLKGWYESWTDTMNRQSGQLTEKQIDDYRRQWEAFVQEGLDIRDQLSDLTGYKGESSAREQQSTSRGFGTEMTHDDAGELSGRFTAVAESNYRIEEAANRQTTAITELKGEVLAITATMQSTYDVADEIRSILANSYLELQEINENTGNTAKYLKDIKADIAIVKQNTSRI